MVATACGCYLMQLRYDNEGEPKFGKFVTVRAGWVCPQSTGRCQFMAAQCTLRSVVTPPSVILTDNLKMVQELHEEQQIRGHTRHLHLDVWRCNRNTFGRLNDNVVVSHNADWSAKRSRLGHWMVCGILSEHATENGEQLRFFVLLHE